METNKGIEAVSVGPALDACDLEPQIDRLVSGDLDEHRRLDLLAWLDAEPARWRRCGLAFLEAQAVREAFATEQVAPAQPIARASFASWLQHRRQMAVAAAVAVCIVAFVLGWALGHRGSPRDSLAASGAPQVAPDVSLATVSQQSKPVTVVGYLRLSVNEGLAAREIMVPVLGGAPGDGSWDPAAGAMPDYVRRQWERQGYRVTQRRQSMPVKLADGRQVDVPVANVTLTYVGQPLL